MLTRPALGAVMLLCATAASAALAGQAIAHGVGVAPAGRASAEHGVQRVPIRPPGFAALPRGTAPQAIKRGDCIRTDDISEAMVMGDRSIELTLKDGQRWHMMFTDGCPFIGFYEGFYLERKKSGKLCAGKDKVIARSGAECAIEGLEQRQAAQGN